MSLSDQSEWRRLDPLMLLVHPVNEVGRFLPVLLAAFVFGSSSEGSFAWQWLAVVAPVAIGVVRYLVTRYRITAGRVELRRGLLGRSVLTTRLDRVRTVELTASPVHRFLGLARVRIGTGAASGGEDQLELDALRKGAAEGLRAALLERADAAPHANVAEGAAGDHLGTAGHIRMSGYVHPLLRLDPLWARYAPFTSSGMVIAGALVAGVGQLLPDGEPQVDVELTTALLVVAAVALLGVLAVLSVVGYLVSYGGYVLSTDARGSSLHVVRGLLTRRETTLESVRVRGLELHEPLTLRVVGARRLTAAVTGMGHREGGSSLLVPPAPRTVVEQVGQGLLRGDQALTLPLRQHGPAARRRRLTRAVLGALLPAGALVVVTGASALGIAAAVLLVVAAVLLGLDRYRRLGHALTDGFLVTGYDSLRGRRVALERMGIIGWTIRQSWFQRRAGLCTLVATTSAGSQGYRVTDVPLEEGVALADAAVPGLLAAFRSAS